MEFWLWCPHHRSDEVSDERHEQTEKVFGLGEIEAASRRRGKSRAPEQTSHAASVQERAV
jgi:hypothetical protein